MLATAIRLAAIPFDLRQFDSLAAAIAYLKGEGAFADRSAHPFPAVVLLDCTLRREAHEPLPPLRSIPGCQTLTLVILTGSDYPRHIIRSYQSGADHFLVKPLDHSDLSLILRTLHDCVTSSPACFSALQDLEHYRHPPAPCN